MNDPLQKLGDHIRKDVSQKEREQMRSEFFAYTKSHPPVVAIPSPFMRYSAAYAFGLLVLVTGPVVYAAEQSLPNDFLYPLKVEVLEPIVVSTFSFTKEGAADAKTALVGRRFTEAQELIVNDRLDDETSTNLRNRIAHEVAAIQTYIEETETGGNLSEALEVGSELETVLEGHGQVLTVLSEGTETQVDDASVDQLVDLVEEEGADTEEVSEGIEDVLSAAASIETNEYLVQVSEEAFDTLEEVRRDVELFSKEYPNGEVVTEAQAFLVQAEDAYSAARSSEEAGVFGSALSEFRDALQAADHARILIQIGE